MRQAIILVNLISHSTSTTLTAVTFSNQLKAGLARFEKFRPEVIVLASSDNNINVGRRKRTLHLYVVTATNLGLRSSDPEPTQRRRTAY